MKIAVQPFFSQQNKATGKFLLDGCLTVRISLFLANKLREEGCDVTVFLPYPNQCEEWSGTDVPAAYRRVPQGPFSNKLQRLDFAAQWFECELKDTDLLLTCNELSPAKVRHVFDGKIALLNNLFPMGGWEWMEQLQRESWCVADCNAFMSEFIRSAVGAPDDFVWPLVYDATKIRASAKKDVDVLFVQRCSVNNYTHHLEFLEALPRLQGLNAVFADPTGYLEKSRPDLNYAHAFGDKYYELLSKTKVVVALMTGDIHGGTSTREAIVSGANPVLLRYPHYQDLARNDSFQGFCDLTSDSIVAAVRRQLDAPQDASILDRVSKESYQATWPQVWKDIQCLL